MKLIINHQNCSDIEKGMFNKASKWIENQTGNAVDHAPAVAILCGRSYKISIEDNLCKFIKSDAVKAVLIEN